MSEQVKACPFCGGEAVLKQNYWEDSGDSYWVECPDCYVSTDSDCRKETVTSAWNRRTAEPNEPLTLERLREMDGEPVYYVTTEKWESVHEDCRRHREYGICVTVNGYWDAGLNNRPLLWRENNYGIWWVAYRRKPEEAI
jgi:Lar family restriction alleviation protein